MHFKQGFFVPKYPEKYVGDVKKIVYRSSWEYRFKVFLDSNPNVLRWNSEQIVIPYIKPTDGKVHRYFPDYWVEFKNSKGEIVQEVIEVKPISQTRRGRSRNVKNKLIEDITYAINSAKWVAAEQFCHKYGMKFRVITENSLFK